MRSFVTPGLVAAIATLLLTGPAGAEEEPVTGIRVLSEPPGARVLVNGIRVGQTPTLVDTAPGTYQVVIIYESERHTASVHVREGRVALVHRDFRPPEGDEEEAEDGEESGEAQEDEAEGGDEEAAEEPPAAPPRPRRRGGQTPRFDDNDDGWGEEGEEDEEGEEGEERRVRSFSQPERRRGARSGEDEEESWEEDEPERAAERPRARSGSDEVDEDDRGWSSEPYARRTGRWPMVDVQLTGSPINRNFLVPIDPSIDRSNRDKAQHNSGWFGTLGFTVGIFPFAHFRPRPLRGLGVEGAGAFALGLEGPQLDAATFVDASYYELDANLLYRLVLGRLDVGAELAVRFGWHRTSFFLGDVGNDLVPPFSYDALRFDVGVRVPLRTRYMLGEVRGGYLFVPSVGEEAAAAYGDGTVDPSVHGAELRVGLIFRVGAFELGVVYVGRLIWSRFTGVGGGFGDQPTTVFGEQNEDGIVGNGIQPTDVAKDSIQQLRLSFGYRW